MNSGVRRPCRRSPAFQSGGMAAALQILLLTACATTQSLHLLLWADLAPGKYQVGYRVIELGSLRISAWYPALAEGEQLRFRDYVPLLDELNDFLHSLHISDATIVDLLDALMYARRNARSLNATFPIVLIFQGNSHTAADQAVLAEFIASHGYVVATINGPTVRSEAESGPKAQEQAAEFARVMSIIGEWPNANPRAVALIGHSFGARAMLLYAMRHSTNVMVSLDGGIGTASGIDALRAAPWFNAERTLPPLLHLYEESDPRMKPDFAFLQTLRTEDLTLERIDSMRHAHFSTWGFVAAALPEIATATKADAGTRGSVTAVAQRVLRFLSVGERPSRPQSPGVSPGD